MSVDLPGQGYFWSDIPEGDKCEKSLQVIRAKPGRKTGGVILSNTWTGVWTHFSKGRTSPCSKTNCPVCAEGFRARWYGYLAVSDARTFSIGILEFTPSALPGLLEERKQHGSLRGMRILLSRANNRINSRIQVEIDRSRIPLESLPAAPDVVQFLLKIWGVLDNDKHISKFTMLNERGGADLHKLTNGKFKSKGE